MKALAEALGKLSLQRLVVAGEAHEVLGYRGGLPESDVHGFVELLVAVDAREVDVLRQVDARAVVGYISNLEDMF